MNKIWLLLLAGAFITACSNTKQKTPETVVPAAGPIQLHPENPHYFLYKGKALALVTSGEHYGSVLNLAFDYHTYLKTLADAGLNYTRMFSGTYFEINGESFGIEHNPLAPKKENICTPWVATPGPGGNPVYDLSKWNDTYFKRLKDFIATAADHNIIVEVTLFSSIYNDRHWGINPQNPENNVNIEQAVSRFDAQTLNNGPLLEYQLTFVRKMVDELNNFDNFFFELQNEPWADHAVPVYNIVNKGDLNPGDWAYKADFADGASMAWQDALAAVIHDEEGRLPKRHLIAQNYTNFKAPIPNVNSHVSIMNFHYAWPEAVEWNYNYNKVIAFDESGFAGSGDQVYRRQAWKFMLSGGGLFNNLDYSFYVGREDGTGKNIAPGGGSPALRSQLKVLSDFLQSFELEKLHPDLSCVASSKGLIPYVLSDGDQSYAIYLRAVGTKHTEFQVKTTVGNYTIQTLNTLTGKYSEPMNVNASNGLINFDIDIPEGELALKITRK